MHSEVILLNFCIFKDDIPIILVIILAGLDTIYLKDD